MASYAGKTKVPYGITQSQRDKSQSSSLKRNKGLADESPILSLLQTLEITHDRPLPFFPGSNDMCIFKVVSKAS